MTSQIWPVAHGEAQPARRRGERDEPWSVLHLQPARTARDLAAQAELGTRIIPAIAEQLAAETSSCDHARRPSVRPAVAAAGAWP
jgi:hypothetical protein